MKKSLLCLLISLLAMFALTGCGMSLPAGMSRSALEAEAEAVAMLIMSRDFEAVCGLLREDVKATTSAEDIEALIGPKLDAMGEFIEIRGFASTGQKVEGSGEKYALIVVASEYENGKKSFNLSFDAEMQLLGIYMK